MSGWTFWGCIAFKYHSPKALSQVSYPSAESEQNQSAVNPAENPIFLPAMHVDPDFTPEYLNHPSPGGPFEWNNSTSRARRCTDVYRYPDLEKHVASILPTALESTLPFVNGAQPFVSSIFTAPVPLHILGDTPTLYHCFIHRLPMLYTWRLKDIPTGRCEHGRDWEVGDW